MSILVGVLKHFSGCMGTMWTRPRPRPRSRPWHDDDDHIIIIIISLPHHHHHSLPHHHHHLSSRTSSSSSSSSSLFHIIIISLPHHHHHHIIIISLPCCHKVSLSLSLSLSRRATHSIASSQSSASPWSFPSQPSIRPHKLRSNLIHSLVRSFLFFFLRFTIYLLRSCQR